MVARVDTELPSESFVLTSSGGGGVWVVKCPSGISSGRLYFSPLGPWYTVLSPWGRSSSPLYATRTNSSKASLPSLEFAVPPIDHAREKTKHESTCFCMSASRLMLAMRPLGSASCSTNNDLNVRMRFTATLVPS